MAKVLEKPLGHLDLGHTGLNEIHCLGQRKCSSNFGETSQALWHCPFKFVIETPLRSWVYCACVFSFKLIHSLNQSLSLDWPFCTRTTETLWHNVCSQGARSLVGRQVSWRDLHRGVVSPVKRECKVHPFIPQGLMSTYYMPSSILRNGDIRGSLSSYDFSREDIG